MILLHGETYFVDPFVAGAMIPTPSVSSFILGFRNRNCRTPSRPCGDLMHAASEDTSHVLKACPTHSGSVLKPNLAKVSGYPRTSGP